MNEHDQFEEHLRRQPLRQVPSAWRSEILAQGRAAAEVNRQSAAYKAAADERVAWIVGWRLVFGRLSLAWASLAALWIALVSVNLMLPTPIVSLALQNPASDRMAELVALDLAPLDYEPATDPGTPAFRMLPAPQPSEIPLRRPRSERRRGVDFGVASPGFLADNLA